MIFFDANVTFSEDSRVEVINTPTAIRPLTKTTEYCWSDEYVGLAWNEYGFLYNFEYRGIITGDKFYIKKMIIGKIRRLIKL